MSDLNDKVLSVANKLEYVLRGYLNCNYTEFGVKANDNLIAYNWVEPIKFALGDKYGASNRDLHVKEAIENFTGNILYGKNIRDLVNNYEYYDFQNQDEAFDYINKVIGEFEKILNM